MLQIAKVVDPHRDGRRPETAYPGFYGGICRRPIRYRHRWHRDLLIQAALDPTIDLIERSQMDITDCLAFEVGKAGYRVLVLGVHDAAPRPKIESNLDIVLVTRSTVLNEPVLSAARAIWATRHHSIAAGDRIRILTALEQEETQSLNNLASVVREPAEAVETILSMICSGELVTAIRAGIRPDMTIWRRSSIALGAPPLELLAPHHSFGCPQEARRP